MKISHIAFVLASLLAVAPVAAEASEVVTNPSNTETVNRDMLRSMLIGKEKFWKSGSEVLIGIVKSDPEVEEALADYCGMTTHKFKNHWQRIAYSGRGKMPHIFSSVEELVEFVRKNEGAIGIISSDAQLEELRRLDISSLAIKAYQLAGERKTRRESAPISASTSRIREKRQS